MVGDISHQGLGLVLVVVDVDVEDIVDREEVVLVDDFVVDVVDELLEKLLVVRVVSGDVLVDEDRVKLVEDEEDVEVVP